MRRRRFKMEECLRSEKRTLDPPSQTLIIILLLLSLIWIFAGAVISYFDYEASPLAVCSRLACCFNWVNGGRKRKRLKTVPIELEQLYCGHGNPAVGGYGKHPLDSRLSDSSSEQFELFDAFNVKALIVFAKRQRNCVKSLMQSSKSLSAFHFYSDIQQNKLQPIASPFPLVPF